MQQWDKMWAINKKVIDPISPRLTALKVNNLCHLKLTNMGPEIQYKEIPVNPLNKETTDAMGNRQLPFNCNMLLDNDDAKNIQEGEKITLMRFGNVNITKKTIVGERIEFTGEALLEDKNFKIT